MFDPRTLQEHISILANNWQAIAVILFACIVFPQSAGAYLDPTAGAIIMQTFYAGWLILVFVLAKAQRHIRSFVVETIKRRKRINSHDT